MEKLIDLLNEYDTDTVRNWLWDREKAEEYLEKWKNMKDFTKWLVDNDKIDLDHLEYKYQDVMYELLEALIIEKKSDFLIMLLSIQDNPINFLISILK